MNTAVISGTHGRTRRRRGPGPAEEPTRLIYHHALNVLECSNMDVERISGGRAIGARVEGLTGQRCTFRALWEAPRSWTLSGPVTSGAR